MCTLIAFWRAVDNYDLVVGMNREESYARPADPPALIEGPPVVVAPRDRLAGGTWLGASGDGLVLALSNRRGPSSPDARSRGLLVLDGFRTPKLPALDLGLQRETRERRYNPFNLFAATRRELRFFRYDGEVSMARGQEGLNVLTNEGGNVEGDPKLAAVHAAVPRPPSAVQDAVKFLQGILRGHGGPASLCVHGAGGGTVSSTILALSNADPDLNVLLYADGAPCQTPYRDYHEVIRRLPIPE